MLRTSFLALGLVILTLSGPTRASTPPQPLSPAAACQASIVETERALGLADGLLSAIGLVESGRTIPGVSRGAPWPWTINAEGEGHFYETKEQAIAAVQAFQARGVRSIDVGCVQVNLMHHPGAFPSLDAAFDPATNVAYGGRFLKALFAEFGNWSDAAAAYHSRTPAEAEPYRQRVIALWPASSRYPVGHILLGGAARRLVSAGNPNADVYGIWPPKGVVYGAIPPRNFAFRCCGSTSAR